MGWGAGWGGEEGEVGEAGLRWQSGRSSSWGVLMLFDFGGGEGGEGMMVVLILCWDRLHVVDDPSSRCSRKSQRFHLGI